MHSAKTTRKVSPSSRACDNCRRKRARCNGPRMLNRICSPCLANGLDCTYQDPAPPRVITTAYVKSLEERLAKAEVLLKKLRSENDLSQERGFPLDNAATSTADSPKFPVMTPTPLLSPVEDGTPPPTDDESLDPIKLNRLESTEHSTVSGQVPVVIGKSSVTTLIQNMYDLKSDLSGGPRRLAVHTIRRSIDIRDPHWNTSWSYQRQLSIDLLRCCPFPDPDLMFLLVARYFSEVNIAIPLLHRPSFERAVRNNLHLADGGFARVLLLVCAVGARYVDDPRVLLENGSSHSAGWKWFEQTQLTQFHLLVAPTLYDIQAHCLTIEYLHSSSMPYCWSMTAIGIRMLQAVGANRKIVYGQRPNASDELWKRAFWVLLIYDRFHSRGLGRACSMADEDYDVDLPIDCDDEYWEHEDPEQAFKQPMGKPSTLSAFIACCKLQPILALALRTLFSLSRSKATLGFRGPEWEQSVVAHLDSSLNMWLDSLPEHLRWNSIIVNDTFQRLSKLLQCAYYSAQLTIHREFISPRRESSPLTIPSRTVCRSAARSCIQVLHRYIELGYSVIPTLIPAMFTSGVVIVLSMWGKMASDSFYDSSQDMESVTLCIRMLDHCQFRCRLAGRHRDVPRELAAFDRAPCWMVPPAIPMTLVNAVDREPPDVKNAHGSLLQDTFRDQDPEYPETYTSSYEWSPCPAPANNPDALYQGARRSLNSSPTNDEFMGGVAPFVSEGEIAMWSSARSVDWSGEWDRWIKELGTGKGTDDV